MDLKHGLVRGALSLGGARIFTNLLNAATLLILARFLTPEDFGIAAIAAALMYSVMSLTQVSIYQALIQRTVVTREHIDTAWTITLIRAALIVLFFVVAAWPLSILYDDPRMVPVFLVAGVTGAVFGLFNPHVNLVTKQMRFGPLTIFQVSQKALALIITIVLAIIFESFWAILIGNLLGAALGSLLSYFIIPYCPRISMAKARDIWSFSGWLFLNQLCQTINWRFDQLAVSVAVPVSSMGHYSMADSLAVLPTRETLQPLHEALFPGLASINGDRVKLAASYLRAQSTIALIALPLGVGLALVAEPAVKVLLGAKWLGIVSLVQLLCCSYSLATLTSCFPSVAMATGQTKLNFLQQLWTMIWRIPLIVVGLLTGGMIGAIMGKIVSEVVRTWISLRYARRLIGVSESQQLLVHKTAIGALLAMAAAITAARPFVDTPDMPDVVQLGVLIAVGGGAYCAAAFATWFFGGRKGGPVDELVNIFERFSPRFKLATGTRS